MEKIKGIDSKGNYLYDDNGQLKIQRVTNENENFLDILGEYTDDKLISLNKACEWWMEELITPTMTQEGRLWFKNKVNAFRKAMKGGKG